MNTRTLLSSLVLVASFGVATAASAAGTVVPAEFGRDGVPSVTVVKVTEPTVAHPQAFGRDVPDTRVLASRAKPATQAVSSAANRFGRA